jgi:hypothetical protein
MEYRRETDNRLTRIPRFKKGFLIRWSVRIIIQQAVSCRLCVCMYVQHVSAIRDTASLVSAFRSIIINVPDVHLARDVMILMRQNPISRAIGRGGP